MAGGGGAKARAAVGLVAAGPEEAAFLEGWLGALARERLRGLRLLLVSPDRAGVEAAQAALARVGGSLAPVRPLTLPALAQRVLDRHGHLLGLAAPRRLLHGEQEWLLLSLVLQGLDLPGPLAGQRSRPGFTRQCLNFINWLRSNDLGPGALERAAAPGSTARALAGAYRAYLERLRAGGLWGFGDLVPAAARLLRQRPDAGRWWRERYECLGAVRCHELGPAAFALLRALVPGGPATNRAPRVALALDPRLYRARLAAPSWFPARDAWRELLEAVEPVEAGGGLSGGPAPAGARPAAGAPPARALGFRDEAGEAGWVARELSRLGEAGVDWADLVVMHCGPQPPAGLEAALERAAVPFVAPRGRAQGGGPLPAVLAWLAALEDPADDGAVRSWLVSALGPGPPFAARAAQSARRRGVSLLEAALDQAAQDEAAPACLELFLSLRAGLERGAGPAPTLAALLRRGVAAGLAQACAGGPAGAARATAWADGTRRLMEGVEILSALWPRPGGEAGPGDLSGLALWLEALGGSAGAAGLDRGAQPGGEGEGAGPVAGQGPGAVRVLPLSGGAPGDCHSVFVLDAVADPAPLPPFTLLEPEEFRGLASALGPLWAPARLDPASALAMDEARVASALACARQGACVCWAARAAGRQEGCWPLPLVAELEAAAVRSEATAGETAAGAVAGEGAAGPAAVPSAPGAGPAAPARRSLRAASPPCALPDHLSPSALKAYLDCPRLFHYRCLLGLQEPPTAESLLGELVHRALALLFGRAPDLSRLEGARVPEEGARALEQAWTAGGVGARVVRALGGAARAAAVRGRATRLLLPYLEGQARGWEAGRRCVAVEAGVSLAVEGFSLRGRVDRVDELPSGGHELIDYKTGRHDKEAEGGLKADFLPAAERRPRDFQLLVYCLGARQGRAFEPAFLGVHQLAHRRADAPFTLRRLAVEPADPRPGDPRAKRLSGGDLEAGRAALLGVLEEMARGRFGPQPREPYACARCYFRLACPAGEGEEGEADE